MVPYRKRQLAWRTMSGGASWQLGDAMRAVELAIVLESLSQTLKVIKCLIAKEHKLSADGVRRIDGLVDSVAMAGNYRWFVPRFMSRAALLTKLLREGFGGTGIQTSRRRSWI